MNFEMPLITFLIGFILLCGWFLALDADRRALALLPQAARFFIIPLLLLAMFYVALGALAAWIEVQPNWAIYFVTSWVFAVLFEEVIKLRASRLCKSESHIFAFLFLFGIIEIGLSKPFRMFGTELSFLSQAALLPAVAMHGLTAAIYAYILRDKPAVQFALCCGIHLLFNWAAIRLDTEPAWVLTVVPFLTLTWVLVRGKQPFNLGQ